MVPVIVEDQRREIVGDRVEASADVAPAEETVKKSPGGERRVARGTLRDIFQEPSPDKEGDVLPVKVDDVREVPGRGLHHQPLGILVLLGVRETDGMTGMAGGVEMVHKTTYRDGSSAARRRYRATVPATRSPAATR